ncbi:hypothetical protein SAY87_020490 [Trapa incisa]|uniref:Vacuolar protein sorting-associated protein 62 n=1 Tax=Trapa incisa TaxID=236973 RepID=A0AAN7JQA2_9MYRT|nr:hypothetical protein SAY87_020490 [Trapa incisa]
MGNYISTSENIKALPIESTFELPSPLPTWPPGEGFGHGTVDLGGLLVCQVTSFNKVWSTLEGGPDNLGATFFEPSVQEEFFILGCYSQPNNQPLHGWVLAAKDQSDALREPIDCSLVWSSESLKIKQDGVGYIWTPIAPDGYKAMGHIVTASPEKPSMKKFRCVREDFTDRCEASKWIWGPGKRMDPSGFNVFSLRPMTRGTRAPGVAVGTFIAQNSNKGTPISLACLKNNSNSTSFMPNPSQIEAMIQAYSPWIYFHPHEVYLPSSVSWFFGNGALLYKKGEESKPEPIDPRGSNLPQGGSNDGAYWLDLPVDGKAKERNGNKAVVYASLHGHASYPKPGLVLQGSKGIGIRNDTAKSQFVMDTAEKYCIIAADYLNTDNAPIVEEPEPPWLNYFREWGPKVMYDVPREMKKVEKFIPWTLRKAFVKLIRSLPKEVLGQEGPTGPKVKNNWSGDEA